MHYTFKIITTNTDEILLKLLLRLANKRTKSYKIHLTVKNMTFQVQQLAKIQRKCMENIVFLKIWISKECNYFAYPTKCHPGRGAFVSEGWRERSQVSYYTRRNKYVTEQIVVNHLQVNCSLAPSIFLSAKSTNQLLSSYELLSAQSHLQTPQRTTWARLTSAMAFRYI